MNWFSEEDLFYFNEGTHHGLHKLLGAHLVTQGGQAGVMFAVWAPDAERVAVVGDFNGWDAERNALAPVASSGIWAGFIAGVPKGALYKYRVFSRHAMYRADKADPFGVLHEVPPNTASVVWDLEYAWQDAAFMATRKRRNALDAPMSIYEVHLGSFMRKPEEGNRSLSYRELAPRLVEHVTNLGFTHVELMPVMEHPFYGSWGYEVTGYFAPSHRYGTPQDFKFLVDALHQAGIGVILDWVPAHFPTDEHGPGFFDGTHLFEHADPRKGFHPDWKSFIFNYDRNEVRAFLLSNAMYWLDEYHIDGLRIDAVASMLYLDYSRNEGEWIPNIYGGRENLGALSLLRTLNEKVYANHPDTQTVAEESTAWPMVSRPTYAGGLGFGLKWDMGWMHDTLKYFERDPIHRGYHYHELTFRMIYAFNENFVLPLSHDEVVHGKGSLLAKMPGDDWQKFANLRLLYGYMFGQPGKKLLFMGSEFAPWGEWSHEASLDWHLAAEPWHAGILRWVADLNRVYREQPALHELDVSPEGFEWVEANDSGTSVLVFQRKGRLPAERVLCAFNFTPVARHGYKVGVDRLGGYREILNSDAAVYGGSGLGNLGHVEVRAEPHHDKPYHVELTLPPLSAVVLKATDGHGGSQ